MGIAVLHELKGPLGLGFRPDQLGGPVKIDVDVDWLARGISGGKALPLPSRVAHGARKSHGVGYCDGAAPLDLKYDASGRLAISQ
eukprot:4070264-Pyramimonas_sp.AAC.1